MTAAAVETRTPPSEDHIRSVGREYVKRLKEMQGLTVRDLADDWDVVYGTARNAIYWPKGNQPKPDRIEALERAAGLPAGTLVEQYYAKRIDPAYWASPTDEAEDEPERPASTGTTRKKATAALAVKTPKATADPLVDVDPSPERVVDGPLRARIVRLERAIVALVPLIAGSAKVDADRLLADLRLGS